MFQKSFLTNAVLNKSFNLYLRRNHLWSVYVREYFVKAERNGKNSACDNTSRSFDIETGKAIINHEGHTDEALGDGQ